jgi:rfaE bifunctional protein nucleotidyltransferase chain/domain
LRPGNSIQDKIQTLSNLEKTVAQWRITGKTVVFTNGCFDILHAGHIASFTEAAQHGDKLVVAVNADAGIRGLKGENRPVNNEDSRALLLASLTMIDAVVIFPDPTPINLILALKPDVLVKGGDYTLEQIVGAPEVMSWGGKVIINKLVPGFSTTSIIKKIQNT